MFFRELNTNFKEDVFTPRPMKWGEMLLVLGFTGIGSDPPAGLAVGTQRLVGRLQSPCRSANFLLARSRRLGGLIALGALFIGSAGWLFRRSEWARLHVAGSEAGLATGLMTVWSGCVWGAAEWGTPWDWTDVRLNTFGLLTLLAIYVVLGRNSQPDGVESRDTFAAFGLYGFVLVPVTYIATRIWTIRHPGPVVATGDEGSINGDMGLVLLLGAISFTVFIIGHMLTSMRLTALEQRLSNLQGQHDGGI